MNIICRKLFLKVIFYFKTHILSTLNNNLIAILSCCMCFPKSSLPLPKFQELCSNFGKQHLKYLLDLYHNLPVSVSMKNKFIQVWGYFTLKYLEELRKVIFSVCLWYNHKKNNPFFYPAQWKWPFSFPSKRRLYFILSTTSDLLIAFIYAFMP